MTPRPHEIPVSALRPWTAIAEAALEGTYGTGDRYTSRHDVFEVGGFRLTFVPIQATPGSVGRVEYVYRERSLEHVATRLTEALERFGFAVPARFDELFARAARIPDDLSDLDASARMASQVVDWAAGWQGFVKLYAENASTGDAMRRIRWMVELRAFQPAFRAASDPSCERFSRSP